jgi:xylulokinase
MGYILAYDVGTSRTKAALVSQDGRVVAAAHEAYPTHYPAPLQAEQDPEDWWKAMAITARAVLESGRARPEEILAVACSTQMLNIIPVDSEVRPIRRCISWLDGRAGAEAKWVMGRLGGPAVFARLLGTAITGKDLIPKYIWLKRNEPDTYRRAASFMDASGYVLHRATGRLVYEWTTAFMTGFFNLKSKKWDTTMMRFVGLDPAKFPELVPSCGSIGGLTRAAAADLGLKEGTPVVAGAGDAHSTAVGSGAAAEGEGHICLGTSGYVAVTTARRFAGKRGIVTTQSADRDKFLMIGEMETCAACLNWAARELYRAEPDSATLKAMDREVEAEAPGSGGLLFAPWMYGERSPVQDERARAGFINLGANHTRAQMTRAIYEGTAYNLAWILESYSRYYRLRPDPIHVVGGGASGRPWVQILADVSGRTLEIVAHREVAGAFGAALIAGVGIGLFSTIEATKALVDVEAVIHPNPEMRATYSELYGAFRSLYPALRDLYHTLNREGPGAPG